ncbi:MAG: SdrD B-like domain-containing protein [Capsulimonas sp.]|uniref:SdrD B-like domain-containing protein n=1 Tax=Capsulimonas sp. TaxID=2494211 RepID=UPI003267443F
MAFINRKSVSILAMLPMCFSLVTGARAQSTGNPTLRGFIVGAEYSQFAGTYKTSAALGQGTPWWFGYRPDIPQAPTSHAEVPVAYGADGNYAGGIGFGDDWPSPLQHIVYNPILANPGFNYLPATDLFKHQTPYAKNTGAYPGVTTLNVTASATFPAETISVNSSHWGGFFGTLSGSNGSLKAEGFPWSSPGSDYGFFNAGDAKYVPYAPGPATANFFIYDIRNSTPVVGANGKSTYDLTSAPDNVSAVTNKARGRLTLRRKDFSARWEFGVNPTAMQYANTFILQGVWEIAAVEGSFTSVFSPADIGKGVGSYGQPQRFFPGLNYNDGNFYNMLTGGNNTQKSMVYQFLPAGVSIVRTYDAVTNTIVETITNNGDVPLYNLTVTDTAAGTSTPFNLAAGQSTSITLPLTSPSVYAGTATVTSHVFGIERGVDVNGVSQTVADTATNVSGVPDASIIKVSAANSGTQLASDINITGVITSQHDGGRLPVAGVTVTLTGTDLNGVAVTLTTTTATDGSYSFPNVAPGTYHAVETAPAGYDALNATPGVGAVKVSSTDLLISANAPGTSSYTAENFQLDKQLGSVSGTLYVDANKNTSLDGGEAGISGIIVTLKDADGNIVATTTTGADGVYHFNGVSVGSYTVNAPATAGDDTLETGASLPVTVVKTQDAPNNNFDYLLPTGSLSGVLYLDGNKNSGLDTGEPGLSGITVTLKDADGKIVATATSDANGAYAFTGITIGSYTVTAPDTASGDTLETAGSLPVTVTANHESPNNNFGYLLPVGSLSGTLYVDGNKNSAFEGGEATLSGITVTLKDANGGVVATTTTGSNGAYSFTGLTIGSYTVTAPATAAGDNLETAGSLSVTVTADKDAPNNNFGYILPVGTLSGTLYVDANKNSTLNTGEAGLSGITVNLLDGSGAIVATTTTGSDGTYSFASLTIGSYTVAAPATAGDDTLETAATLSVTVTADKDAPNNNFGYVLPVGSVSGTLFVDGDKDGAFDNGEATLNGITVNLLDANGATVASTTTNSSGYYSFTGLASAAYTVSAPAAAGGYALETSQTLPVTVVGNQNDGDNDFGYIKPVGSLSGVFYLDGDKDSQYDAGEALFPGVTVTLKDASGSIVATTTTDSDGAYSFTGLTVGSYTVSAPGVVSGDLLETSANLNVTVTANHDTPNNNFGYIVPLGSLSGTLYLDANKNSTLNTGEAGISGLTVNLVDASGAIVATTTTGSDGTYSFAGIVAGSYTVTAPSASGTATLETSGSLNVTVSANQNSGNNNFGYVLPALGSLSGTLYVDGNKNSGLDNGETGLSGLTVNLLDAAGNIIATTTTGSNGTYSFTGLAAGSYRVVAPGASGTYTLETTGTLTVGVVASQNAGSNNFGYIAKAPVSTGGLCGTVYLDNNKDGKAGCGDSALSGITVTLVDSTGKTIATTTTDNYGNYSFKNVPTGTYKVVVPTTAGSNVIETTDPLTVTITANQTVCNVNFGYTKPAPGCVTGKVYVDGNKNGAYNSGETVLSGVTVTLVDSTGKTIAATTTDCNGNYALSNIPAGSYKVVVPTSSGSNVIETTDPLAVTVTSGQTTANNNFGYVKPAVGNICGTVYLDCNKDKKLGSGDSFLSGITVTLKDANGNVVATTTTDCNGNYTFKNLPAGSYTVSVPTKAGSNPIETTDPLMVSVAGNQTTSSVNFGYTKPATGGVCGTVYCDNNRDGHCGRGDTALCGVSVTLKDCNGKTVCSTKTDSCGNYSFSGVAAGSCTVSVPATANSCSAKSSCNQGVTIVGNQTSSCHFTYGKY